MNLMVYVKNLEVNIYNFIFMYFKLYMQYIEGNSGKRVKFCQVSRITLHLVNVAPPICYFLITGESESVTSGAHPNMDNLQHI